MGALSKGWSFLQQAWKLMISDKDLIMPSIYGLLVSFCVTLIGLVPLALVALVLGTESVLARVFLGLLGVLIVFSQYAVSYIFSSMTVKLVVDYLMDGDGRMDRAWEIVRRDWLDILSLAAASTLVNVVRSAISGKGKNKNAIGSILGSLIETAWTEATFLVLPIMVLEDMNLKDALKRATYIFKNNLLLIGISTVGVRTVNQIIGFALGLIGLGLGWLIAMPFISMAGQMPAIIVLGVVLGGLVASVFFMAASVLGSYTSTVYHTCLYLWARDVETSSRQSQENIPAPLAAVLGR